MAHYKQIQGCLSSNVDGLGLQYHGWVPSGDIRRILLIQHGFGEHSLRFQNVIEAVGSETTAIFAMDARGHGSSAGIRGHADSFHDFAKDLRVLVDHVSKTYPGTPIGLFGHSMGGAIALDYCLTADYQKGLSFLVLSAPAVRIKMTPLIRVKKFIGAKLAKLLPSQVINAGIDPHLISQDPDVVRAYSDDPKVHGKISFAMGTAFFAIGEQVLKRAAEITLPIYIFHGTADGLCMPAGSEELFSKVGSDDKKLRFYPNLHHETFNEKRPERDAVLKDLAEWVSQHS